MNLDVDVLRGAEERLGCRLSARRAPAEVVRKRLRDEARRRGESVSAWALPLARWTILVTNVPRDLLSVAEALEWARMRWQIELVFQLWKSHGGIDEWSTARPYTALCAVCGKLLAMMVVRDWTIVVDCWTRADRGPIKAARVVGAWAMSLALAIPSRERLRRLPRHAAELMKIACRMERHQGSPNAHDRILCFGSEP